MSSKPRKRPRKEEEVMRPVKARTEETSNSQHKVMHNSDAIDDSDGNDDNCDIGDNSDDDIVDISFRYNSENSAHNKH